MEELENIYDYASERIRNYFEEVDYLKVGLIIGGSLVSIYLLSFVFRITAGTIRSFNDFRAAMNGQ